MVVTLDAIPGQPDLGANVGYLRMDAPAVLEPSTSVSHFSREQATPLLMKGSISLWNFDRNDMTTDLLRDIGWTLTPGSGNTIFTAGFETYTPRRNSAGQGFIGWRPVPSRRLRKRAWPPHSAVHGIFRIPRRLLVKRWKFSATSASCPEANGKRARAERR